MLENLFKGLFDSASTTVIAPVTFLLCVGAALAIGGMIAFAASRAGRFHASFLTALTVLPALTAVTIMMVNGNVGAGVATAGAFSLVRFRSAAGSAKEIAMIFLSMVAGVIAGMGYLAYALLFAVVLSAVFMAMGRMDPSRDGRQKVLRVTIPEDLDYDGVFDSALDAACEKRSLDSVRTAGMGALYRLTWSVTLRPGISEKAFIDRLRCLNGNLEVSLSRQATTESEL